MPIDDGLGDWRISAASRLAKDVPTAFEGGPSHKAGAAVYQTTVTRDRKNIPVGFITPNSTALALSIAIRVSTEANLLLASLTFDDVLTPHGKGRNVSGRNLAALYDYFEYSMMSVTFSFQALETFCNYTISKKQKGVFNLRRKKEVKQFSPFELERDVSTEEKLEMVLPELVGIKSPKGKKVWQNFVRLKRARDATIHLKSVDQYPNQYPENAVDRDSLFYQFLNNKPTDFPRDAITMIKYFILPQGVPRWFAYPLEFLEGEE